MFFTFWISLIIAATARPSNYGDDSVVATEYGKVQGQVLKNARQFLSIPFAEPPVGDLRWSDPQKHAAWDDTYDATYCRAGCIQPCDEFEPFRNCTTVSDDCLYLTVFTPLPTAAAAPASDNWKVMLWIHGGSFWSGDGCDEARQNATVLVNRTNIVLVSISYRLGATGFLWDDTTGLTGNYGLMDQLLAIEWVYNNIAAFGGDPESIFIAGQSAGATSVGIHLMNTEDTIVKGAIMESNPAGVPLRDAETWNVMAGAFKDALGCSDKDYPQPSDQLVCMKGANKERIVVAQEAAVGVNGLDEPLIFLNNFMPFTPTIGSNIDWLDEQPIFSFQKGDILDVPILGGTLRNETDCFVSPVKILNPMCKGEFDDLFGIKDARILESLYDCPNNRTNDCRNCSKPIQNDAIFRCPFRNLTMSAAKQNKNPVYWYHFNHVSSFNKALYPNGPSQCWPNGGGVCHSADIPYVFGATAYDWADDEWTLSDMIQLFWASFVKSGGDPNAYTSIHENELYIPWTPYNATTQATMLLDVDKLRQEMMFEQDVYYCNVWDSLDYTWYK